MELKFKTNINCSGCVAQATPFLNETCGVGNWEVDTNDPGKVLTVRSGDISSKEVQEAVEKAGFRVEQAA
jgi:copper chaperone